MKNKFSKSLLSIFAIIIMTFPASLQAQETVKRHQIAFMLSDVVFTRISFDYEQILDEKTMFSLHMPVSVALSPLSSIIDAEEMKFWVGVGCNIYPTGQGRFKYFLGPEMRYSLVDYISTDFVNMQYVDELGNPMYITKEQERRINDMSSLYFLVNNGVIFTPTSSFAVSAILGLGIQSRLLAQKDLDYGENILPSATFSVRLGYKF